MGSVSNLQFKDGDGDEVEPMAEVSIRLVSNGYLVTLTTEEEEEYVNVYEFGSKEAMLEMLRDAL